MEDGVQGWPTEGYLSSFFSLQVQDGDPTWDDRQQFFGASQENPLHDILPEKVDDGEIIEIDDGLQPYYFYVLDLTTVIPLRYFRLPQGDKAVTEQEPSQSVPK